MKCEKNHILRKLVRVSAWVTPACQGGHDPGRCDHEGKVYTKGGASSSFTPRFDARLPADADGVRRGRCPARHPRAAPGLHARCLSPLRRRDPERPGDHRMLAPAEGEPEFGLCRGVRAVGLGRSLHFERGQIVPPHSFEQREEPGAGKQKPPGSGRLSKCVQRVRSDRREGVSVPLTATGHEADAGKADDHQGPG